CRSFAAIHCFSSSYYQHIAASRLSQRAECVSPNGIEALPGQLIELAWQGFVLAMVASGALGFRLGAAESQRS
ncbi:MAG: hypothetical protein ACRYFX_13880, partial [Janthinobacterium lividum]